MSMISASKTHKNEKKYVSRNTMKRNRLLFYIGMTAIPLIQFALFFIYVKFNSILMAFREYDLTNNGYVISFAGFENFSWAWKTFINGKTMVGRSLIVYAFDLFVVLGFALLFSYYIAKKQFGAGFFRVILFLPQVVPGIVFASLYEFLVTDVYKVLNPSALSGLLTPPTEANTQFIVLLIFHVWIGFGTNVLMLTSSMSAINESVVEAAKLDGVNTVQEFIYIYIPMIFPTFVTFIIVGMSGIFTNQMHMYSFYSDAGTGEGYPSVFGYYFYAKTRTADYYGVDVTYSQLSALGLLFTAILMPIVLTARKLLNKYGPSAD